MGNEDAISGDFEMMHSQGLVAQAWQHGHIVLERRLKQQSVGLNSCDKKKGQSVTT